MYSQFVAEMILDIPQPIKTPLLRLSSLSETEFGTLIAATRSGPAGLNAKAFAQAVQASALLDEATVRPIVEVIFSLGAALEDLNRPMSDFLSDVAESVRPDGEARQSFDPRVLANRLEALLTSTPVATSLRAAGLKREYDRVYGSARIITDVRPVFAHGTTDCVGFEIVHNLRLTYFEDYERKRITFALDSTDISDLRKSLDRAEAKAENLKEKIGTSGLLFVDIE